jgi:hypothetical protein
MLFNVEADRGNQIVGYVVPDDFNKSSTLRIIDGGSKLAEVPCVEERPALVVAGRHATGRCGFTIDESIIPNLAKNEGLELYEAETNILIYRRRKADEVTHQRVFRLETHLFPLWRLDEGVEHRFKLFHKGIERHGRETAMQVFNLHDISSMYLSGRLALKAYENLLHDQFQSIALVHDPYVELAERLLTLKHVTKFGDELLGPRDTVAYRAAIEFAQHIEPDEQTLRRAFDIMPKEAIALLANPLTRQLAAESPEDPPPRGGVAKALSALSYFTILGVRENPDLFLEELEALLDIPRGTLPPPPSFSKRDALARELRAVPEVELLLEQDLEVYHTLKSAVEGTL